jgi:putative chitinase
MLLVSLQGVTDPAHIAYLLATTGHETSFRGPIEEYEAGWRSRTGRGDYAAIDPATGNRYFGRGYVQVTWAENYKKIDRILGTDTYHHPEQMLDPAVAAPAAAIGMRDGIFSGRSLADYGYGDNFDWLGARSIINDGDLRSTIGGYGRYIYNYIKNTDPNAIEQVNAEGASTCGAGSVVSPIAGKSIEETLAYEVDPVQDFDAYRAYRNGYHGGVDFDRRIGMGEGGQVVSVANGEIRSIVQVASNENTGEPSVSVRIISRDSSGNEIEQQYTHLSVRAVEAALGCGIGECVGQPIQAGQPIGNVGGDDTISSGAHLDYKVKVNGQFVDPMEFLAAISSGGGTITTIDLASGRQGTTTVGSFGTSATATDP